jgi:MFS family permease
LPATEVLTIVAEQRGPVGTTDAPRASRRDRLAIPVLVAAQMISSTGNSLTAVAIPWFVLVTTGSAARTGLVAFAGTLPVIIAGLLGGAVVDRLGYRRSSVISDIASGLTVALIPTLHLLDLLQFWHLLVLAFAGALLDVPGSIAREAMVPTLARRVGMPLERSTSVMQLAMNGATIVGPVLAGVLIAAVGAASTLYFDAASFGLSALMIGLAVTCPVVGPTPTPAAVGSTKPSLIDDSIEGVRFILRDRLLATLIGVSVFGNLIFAPLFPVVLPVYVRELFGDPHALGLLAASFGIGSIGGSLAFGAVGPSLPRYAVYAGGAAMLSAGYWLLALSPALAVSMVAGVVMGLAVGPLNILSLVILQEKVPQGMLGRVYGALGAMSQLAAPAGVLGAGMALDVFAVRGVLTVLATLLMLVMLAAMASPTMRRVEHYAPRPARESHR